MIWYGMWKKDTCFAGEPIPENLLRDVKHGPTFYEHDVKFQVPIAKKKALDPEIDDIIGTVSVINNSWFNFFSFFLIAMIPIIPLALVRWGRFFGAFYAGLIEGLLGLLFALTGNAFYVALVQGMAEEATLEALNNHYLLTILWQGIEWGQLCDGMNTILLNKAWAPGHLERMWIERGAKVGAMGYAPPIDISEHFNLINQFRKFGPFVKPSDLAPPPYSNVLLKAVVNYDYVVTSALKSYEFSPPEFSWPGPFDPYYVYRYETAGGILSKYYSGNFVDYIIAGMRDYISKGDYKYSYWPEIRWRYIDYALDKPPLCIDGAMQKGKNYSMTNMPLYDSITLIGEETIIMTAKAGARKYALKPVTILTTYQETVAPLVFPSVRPYKFEPKTKIDINERGASQITYIIPRPLFEAGHLLVRVVLVCDGKPSKPRWYVIPVTGCVRILFSQCHYGIKAFYPKYTFKGSVLKVKLSAKDDVIITGIGTSFECDVVLEYSGIKGYFEILIGDCVTDFITGDAVFKLEIDPNSRCHYDVTIIGTFRHSNSAFDFSYGFWRNYINGIAINRIDSVPKKIMRDVAETHKKVFEKLRIVILKAVGIAALALLLPVLAISGSIFFYQRPWWVDWVLRLYIDEKTLEEADVLIKTISPVLQDYANWTMVYYPNFVRWFLTEKHAPAIPSPTSPFALAMGSPTGEYAVRDPFKAIRGLTLADVITYFLMDLADFAQELKLPRGLGLAAMISAADEIGKYIDYYMPPATPGLKVGGTIVRENLKALMIAVEKALKGLIKETLNDIPRQLFDELCVNVFMKGIETDGTYVLWVELLKALRAHIITAECKLAARWLKKVKSNVLSLIGKMMIYLYPHRFPIKIRPRTLYNVIAATSDHPVEVFWHMRGMQLARTLSLNVQYLRAWSRGETLD